MEGNIGSIVLDDDIYPRLKKRPKKVDEYAEKLSVGVKFPPIEVQRVSEDGEDKTILLDGYHRWEAHKKLVKEPELLESENSDFSTIEAVYWKEEVLDRREWLNELRIRAVKLNKHGIPPSRGDLKEQARRIARDDPDHEKSSEDIAKEWDLPVKTVNNWIQDIRAAQRASRHQIIHKLDLLGWTQEQVAKVLGLTQTAITKIMKNGQMAKIHNSIKDWLAKGKTVGEAAEKLEIDATLAWALYLSGSSDEEGKPDGERLELLDAALVGYNLSPKDFDVWNFSGCMPLTGSDSYAGRIPGQIVLNTLYYFTDQDDLVIDPMAGGGTTVDACLLLSRRCFAYDIAPTRRDILQHDITKDAPAGKKADLIFLDPPYFKKKAEEYNLPEEYMTKDGFMGFAKHWVKFCEARLKAQGYVALLISGYVDYDDASGSIFSDEYARLFEAEGYVREYMISCDLSTEQAAGYDIERSRELRQLLSRGRELYILRKVDSGQIS